MGIRYTTLYFVFCLGVLCTTYVLVHLHIVRFRYPCGDVHNSELGDHRCWDTFDGLPLVLRDYEEGWITDGPGTEAGTFLFLEYLEVNATADGCRPMLALLSQESDRPNEAISGSCNRDFVCSYNFTSDKNDLILMHAGEDRTLGFGNLPRFGEDTCTITITAVRALFGSSRRREALNEMVWEILAGIPFGLSIVYWCLLFRTCRTLFEDELSLDTFKCKRDDQEQQVTYQQMDEVVVEGGRI